MRRSLLAGLAVAVAVALGGGYVGPATAAASSGTGADLNFLQEGSEFSGDVAHFDLTTGQPNSTNPVTIDWGDGTTPTGGTVKQIGTNSYDVSGTHTYAEEGNYLFFVTLHTSEGDVQTFGVAHAIDPAPSTTGATWRWSSSSSPAARYWRTALAPPAIDTSCSPAAARACSSADSIPSVTKLKVVPPCIGIGSRAWWVSTKTGAW